MAQTSSTAAYKISFRKIARAAAAEVLVHKKLAIISFVLYGVAFLLNVFNSEANITTGGYITLHYSGWGLIFMVGGIAVSYFTALNVFRDMYNQQFCDVSMALPIKASERFFSKLLCLFYLQTAPLILSTFVGYGIKLLYALAKYGGNFSDGCPDYFMISFGALASSMFIMAIAVLCTCCCGAAAESAYLSLIAMFIINFMPIIYINNVICGSSGFIARGIGDVDAIVDLGYWGLMFLLGDAEEIAAHAAVGCVISLAVMLLSGFIYVKRDARSVGTPIASRVFFEIIMFTGCVTVFSMFVMSDIAFWGLLVAGVIYVIINIIVSRAKINALSFLKWAGKFAATAALYSILLVSTVTTGGFGLINSRPDVKYLSSAEFTIYYYSYESNYDYRENTRFVSERLSAEQADQLIKIYKKHIIKGRSEMSPVDVIFGNVYNSSAAQIYISAEGHRAIPGTPSPKSYFRYNYNASCYVLDYEERIQMPLSETKALIDELTELGLIHPYKEIYDTEVSGTTVSY